MNILPFPDILFNLMLLPVFSLLTLLVFNDVKKEDITKLFTLLLITPLLLLPLTLTTTSNALAIIINVIIIRNALNLTRVSNEDIGVTSEMVQLGKRHRMVMLVTVLVSNATGTYHVYTSDFDNLSIFLTGVVFINLITVYYYVVESTDDFVVRAKRGWFL